ncbi:MAG TPA: diguanylate cyclase [Candidatus Acidoferrales bacterium]|nr:diguanylate cyclase [Candidatus Acidoferrales bacterium]
MDDTYIRPPAGTEVSLRQLQAGLRRLERRDWWLWVVALLLLLLLCTAIAALGVTILLRETDSTLQLQLHIALRGLVGLVLLFGLYTVYQLVVIKDLRRGLTEQIEAAARSEVRAEEFHQLALRDPLTGLYNRRAVEEQLQAEFARSDRHDYPLAALLLDVDGLKAINDHYGHPAGDQVLRAFAQRLRKAVRSSDLPARMGGDEFIVVLPECTPELVPRVVARLSGLEVELDDQRLPVTFSAGWTGYEPGESLDSFLARADRALYDNKRTGKVEEEVQQVQAQLRQAQKMEVVGRLAGGVAHDFNNLLMVIKGYSELLAERLGENDPLRRMAQEALKAADRAAALTHQLMAFSRQQKLEPQVLDLNAVVANVEGMLRRVLGEHIELATQGEPELPSVEADPGQLEQVIMNLAVNARDAMPKGGKLTIATSSVELDAAFVRSHHGARPGAHVRLTVTDTGVGMDRATQTRIFEPFFTTKAMGRGTGLGLATVYGIVKQNGGYIGIESDLGKGTTFSIYLPSFSPTAQENVSASEAPAQAD